MQTFSTSRCHEFDHPEFKLMCDPQGIAEAHILSLVSGLEAMVAEGSVFQPDDRFHYGWVQTKVRELEDGMLTLDEPDMKSMPINYVPGITETLRHMMLQLFTADSFGIDRADLDFPSLRQSGIACRQYSQGEWLMMARAEPTDELDSGWFIGCGDKSCDHNDSKNLQRLSLYEVFLNRPQIRDWVSLPFGALLQQKPNVLPVLFLEGQPQKIEPGSFLDQATNR